MNHIESYRESAAVIDLDAESRGTFVSRTYTHLFSAIAAFTLIEVILFRTGLAATINNALFASVALMMWYVLRIFMSRR